MTLIPDNMTFSGTGEVYLPGLPEPGGVAVPGGTNGMPYISYGGGVAGGASTKNTSDSFATGYNTVLFSETTNTPGLPDSGENFTQNSWDIANQGWNINTHSVYAQPFLLSDTYLHFSWKDYSDGTNYQTVLGTLQFDTVGTLVAIEYGSDQIAVPTLDINNGPGPGGIGIDTGGGSSPAPEPAEWALLMAGMGLSGAALRQRRRAAPAS